MKKILIVSRTTVFHNKSGGMETQLLNLIKGLKSNNEITVLTTSKTRNQKINVTEIIDGVTYIFLKDTIPGEYGFNLYEALFWQIPIKRNFSDIGKNFRVIASRFYRKHLSQKFDVILSQSSSANNFKIKKPTKLILIYHGTTINELRSRIKGMHGLKDLVRVTFLDLPSLAFEYAISNTFLFSKATKIVLVSNLIKNDFKNQYPLFKKKITVIENAIDTEKFKPSEKYKKFTVIYFGRIDFEKGLGDFIYTAKQLPITYFRVYGDGTDKTEFIKLVRKENLPNLEYFGAIDNTELSKILSKSHCFLFLTKRKEGFPMSIIESLSCGVGVVTTLNLAEISKNIPFVKVGDVKSAVEEITKLQNHPNLLKDLARKGSKYANLKYSLSSIRDRYEKII